jgi:sulfite reductase (NADPH) flavoprotein alpha-component
MASASYAARPHWMVSMSSAPLHAPGQLPDNAPFSADQIRLLNTVLARASGTQRAWLSGFLAGIDAAQLEGGEAPQVQAAAPPAARMPLTILFGTESGNSESLAADTRKAAARLGFAPSVLDMADATPETLAKVKNLIVIASTWGEGEPPQRATDFYTALMAEGAPRLEGLHYAVLALGDRAYVQFCAVGHAIDARLAALGATRAAPLGECDVDYAAPAAAWIGSTLKAYAPERGEATVISLDTRRAPSVAVPDRNAPFVAEITEHVNLHSSRSSAETVHMELSLAGSGIAYEPGDALAVLPRNEQRTVDAILAATGRGGDAELAELLATGRDITTLTPPMLAGYAEITGDIALQAIAKNPAEAANFIAGKQALDLFESARETLGREQLLSLLRPLPPRYYSIASSQKAVGEQADLLVARLSWTTPSGIRYGVASNDLVAQRRKGDQVRVWLKPNTHFRLPADPDRPIIMIGPGTGVAPFRAFVQDRRETGAKGRNWLFFGHRQFTHDFLYQLEWQDAMQDGSLARIDLAFSRDQPEKIYVQHRLWQRRDALLGWLDEGAVLYVCGDKAMGADVDATLLRIFEDAKREAGPALSALKREGRYLKDVY